MAMKPVTPQEQNNVVRLGELLTEIQQAASPGERDALMTGLLAVAIGIVMRGANDPKRIAFSVMLITELAMKEALTP